MFLRINVFSFAFSLICFGAIMATALMVLPSMLANGWPQEFRCNPYTFCFAFGVWNGVAAIAIPKLWIAIFERMQKANAEEIDGGFEAVCDDEDE